MYYGGVPIIGLI